MELTPKMDAATRIRLDARHLRRDLAGDLAEIHADEYVAHVFKVASLLDLAADWIESPQGEQ